MLKYIVSVYADGTKQLTESWWKLGGEEKWER
jgi:hypothetical protein